MALHVGRQQRIRPRRRRPDLLVDAQHPERVELSARRLQRPEHLDGRRALGLGLEHALAALAHGQPRRLREADLAGDDVERVEPRQRVEPGLLRLPLVAGKPALAGPAGGVEQFEEFHRPLRRPARRTMPRAEFEQSDVRYSDRCAGRGRAARAMRAAGR
jgi:hypothetical protein